jgi:hypothetical protein
LRIGRNPAAQKGRTRLLSPIIVQHSRKKKQPKPKTPKVNNMRLLCASFGSVIHAAQVRYNMDGIDGLNGVLHNFWSKVQGDPGRQQEKREKKKGKKPNPKNPKRI